MRDKATYLETDVWRALWLLSRARSHDQHNVTVEQLVDEILRSHITQKYPQLFQHQKAIEKLDKEILKDL